MEIKRKTAIITTTILLATGFTAIPEKVKYENVPIPETIAIQMEERDWNSISRPMQGDIVMNESWLLPDSVASITPKVFQTEFHAKQVNFLGDSGFQSINTEFVVVSDGFTMENAPFSVHLPLKSDGVATFVNNNRFNIHTKKEITEPPFSVTIEAVGVLPVQGKIVNGGLMSKDGYDDHVSYVLYENAYPNADLIYYVRFGVSPHLEKLIRFHSKPSVLTYHFLVDTSENTVLNDKAIMVSDNRGAGFLPFAIWDSASSSDPDFERNILDIPVDIRLVSPRSYRITKTLPKTFFLNAEYPVYTDTVTTVYPNANPESTSVDGRAQQTYALGSGQTWATIIGAAGNGANDSATSDNIMSIASDSTSSKWQALRRGFFLFDTSSIPDADTISAATLSIYGSNKGDALAITPNIDIYTSAPTSNTAIATGDYDQTGSVSQTGASIAYADISTTGYNDFAFNATGLGNISKTGVSKFSARNANYDVAASAPAWNTGDATSFFTAVMADTAGTTQDPKLVITHAGATTARFGDIIFFD